MRARSRLDGRRLRLPVARGCPPLMGPPGPGPALPAGQVRSVTLAYDAGPAVRRRDRRGPGRRLPGRAGSRTRPGWPGWTWASSTPMPPPGRTGRGCWCPGGRSAPNAASTCVTARPAAAPPRPRAPARGSAGRGAGASTGAASGGRGPARPPGPAGPARGRQDRHRLGGGAPDRHPGGRRPARRAGPASGAAAQPADPGLADRAPDQRPGRQGRGRRDHRAAGR